MTLRMNGVWRTRNIMQREKEREKDSSPHRAKKGTQKSKTNSQSQNEHTNTLLRPPISRPIRCQAKAIIA